MRSRRQSKPARRRSAKRSRRRLSKQRRSKRSVRRDVRYRQPPPTAPGRGSVTEGKALVRGSIVVGKRGKLIPTLSCTQCNTPHYPYQATCTKCDSSLGNELSKEKRDILEKKYENNLFRSRGSYWTHSCGHWNGNGAKQCGVLYCNELPQVLVDTALGVLDESDFTKRLKDDECIDGGKLWVSLDTFPVKYQHFVDTIVSAYTAKGMEELDTNTKEELKKEFSNGNVFCVDFINEFIEEIENQLLFNSLTTPAIDNGIKRARVDNLMSTEDAMRAFQVKPRTAA
mgnify:FL=1|tara:strand:- start:65 stop:919 length:855 start_codon:yes stop_codon:yes gene_type:complete